MNDLIIDPAEVKDKLVSFLSHTLSEKDNIKGLMIYFTGHIDSTVITRLAIEAIGEEKIKLIVKPNKTIENNDLDQKIIKTSLDYLGLTNDKIIKVDVSPAIKSLNADEFSDKIIQRLSFLNYNLGYSMLHRILHKEIEENVYAHVLQDLKDKNSDRDKFIHRLIVYNRFQNRLQMAFSFLYAESEYSYLVGTLNKTEYLTGLFTKFGNISVDIMPLINLYRSQILQLADYLKIPGEIRNLSKPSSIPNVRDKYHYFFELPVEQVDRILIRLEKGNKSTKEIAKELEIPLEAIERVNYYFETTQYQRAVPLAPPF